MNLARFSGGRGLMRRSVIVGAAGLLLTFIGGLFDARHALFSYLTAFIYWLGIALGMLILLGAFHASSARWAVLLRRIVETIPVTAPLFLVLFIPILLGMRQLFSWVHPTGLDGETLQLIRHRRTYLNVPFFIVRAALYFGIWIVVSEMLRAWSVRQDTEGGVVLTVKQRRLGAGSLPFLALTMAFAAFDWLMSLDPHFYSTIFGVYWFAGGIMAAVAVLIIVSALARGEDLFGHYLSANHFHSLGKYLFAFVCFWAYIAFSQFMLMWIANLPEEVPWFLVRNRGGWAQVGIFLIVFHFVVPFLILLSRGLKRRPAALAIVAGWMLVAHYVDTYWLVMPALSHRAPSPSWMDLAALVGVGGAAVAFAVWRLRGAATVPVGDPYLEDSLEYEPEQ